MKKRTRREFLKTSSLATSCIILTSPTPYILVKNTETTKKKSGFKIGLDADKLYDVKNKGTIAVLNYTKHHGFDGVFYRTMLDMSPTLDKVELKEFKAHADSLGLYLDGGIGWVNPYNTAETPEIRRFGNGDYLLAVEKMIDAARLIDCTELYAVSGHSVHGDPFFVAYDRFRTDVTWGEQLQAITRFINKLSSRLRDLGCRVNLEIHGDETSFELIRLINDIGPDITGVTLDTGNLPLCGDVPLDAIKRLAPYVHMTHVKDGILYKTKEGLVQQLRPIGQGIIDWEQALTILHQYEPDLHLSFEDYRTENLIRFYDKKWRYHFPELTGADISKFEQLADQCNQRIKTGEILNVEEFRKLQFTDADRLMSYKRGAQYLREIIERKGLR